MAFGEDHGDQEELSRQMILYDQTETDKIVSNFSPVRLDYATPHPAISNS